MENLVQGKYFARCFTQNMNIKMRSRQKRKIGKNIFDELNDALICKDLNSFWKRWHSKFSKTKASSVIDGVCDPSRIAENFAYVFKNTCVPNSPDKHCALKDEFYHNWFNYRCDLSNDFHVDVEMIE